MNIKWSNVPIPEGHLVGLIGAVLLHVALPLKVFSPRWLGHALGWPAIIAGIVLAGWAVTEAGSVEVASPSKLVTTGPYALSRNPMYLAWTLISLGIALAMNTLWLLLLLPLVIVFTHFREIVREERTLRQQFGAEYEQYCRNVRRYL